MRWWRERWEVRVVAVCMVAVMASGCATIAHGARQSVEIMSTPPGAVVMIDGSERGRTPTVVMLSCKDHHTMRLELAGYQPYEMQLKRGISGWFFGNIIFGGLIGIVVDVSTGAMYKLSPGQIDAVLEQQGATAYRRERDALYVAVAMRADPSWERIAALPRVTQ